MTPHPGQRVRTRTEYPARWSGKEGTVRWFAEGNVRVDFDDGSSVTCGPLEVEPIAESVFRDRKRMYATEVVARVSATVEPLDEPMVEVVVEPDWLRHLSDGICQAPDESDADFRARVKRLLEIP